MLPVLHCKSLAWVAGTRRRRFPSLQERLLRRFMPSVTRQLKKKGVSLRHPLRGFYSYSNAEHFKCNDLRRWRFSAGSLFSIRLHHWVKGDPEPYQHAHPWNFLTIVLSGGYEDVGEGRETDYVRAPTLRYRRLDWRHSVINVLPGTWTIVITGRILSKWRFWMHGREVTELEWNERICD